MSASVEAVRQALEGVQYPGFTRNIVSFGLVKEIQVEAGQARIAIEHTIKDSGVLERIRRDITTAAQAVEGVEAVEVDLRAKGASAPAADAAPAAAGGHSHAPAARPVLPQVKHVIAVASAKGGVGKSTVASNLALALSRAGKRTGLMDADVYGPSVPTMLGTELAPVITADKRILPVEKHGLKLMSMGFLVPPEKAMIWRGPLVMGAIQQFLTDVDWGELDILVVDLPPGTGDAQLTLAQKVPLAGAVLVTTPQLVALADVVRGIHMFEKTEVPLVGVLENMSGFRCSNCETIHDIFGSGGGQKAADRYGVPFLGALPIDPSIREGGDAGLPVVAAHPDSAAARSFTELAWQVVRFLENREESAAEA